MPFQIKSKVSFRILNIMEVQEENHWVQEETPKKLGNRTQHLFVIFYIKYLTKINKFLVPKIN